MAIYYDTRRPEVHSPPFCLLRPFSFSFFFSSFFFSFLFTQAYRTDTYALRNKLATTGTNVRAKVSEATHASRAVPNLVALHARQGAYDRAVLLTI